MRITLSVLSAVLLISLPCLAAEPVAAKQDPIEEVKSDLASVEKTMNEQNAASEQRLNVLEKKTTDRKRMAEDAYAGMQELTNRLFKKVQDELIPLVEQMGKERGCEIVFDLQKSGAAWFNPAIDLTPELIKRYDASKAVPGK